MIGIQQNTVLGYSGKVKGELMSTYYQGNDGTTPYTALKSIIIKDIQVFNELSTPIGLAKFIIVKDRNGKLVSPGVPLGARTQIDGTSGFYDLILSHDEGSSGIDLKLMNRQTKSASTLCTWGDNLLMVEPAWSFVIDSFHAVLSETGKVYHMVMVAAVEPGSQNKKYYHIKEEMLKIGVNLVAINQDIVKADLPTDSLSWRSMYTYISENYPENLRINGAENAAFVSMSSNEGQILQLDNKVNNLDARLSSVETSANSRYVSR